MSRFEGSGDEEYPGQWQLWEAALIRSASGRKGQAALREIRDALLSLPEPVLIRGRIADEQGCVCVVGALALHRGVTGGRSRDDVLAELARLVPADLYDEYGWEAEEQTIAVGNGLGLTRTLAVHVASTNDDPWRSGDETPEHRYARVLRHVESLILEPVPS